MRRKGGGISPLQSPTEQGTEDGFLWRSVGVAESGDGFGDDEERKDDGKLLPKVAEEEGCHNGGKGRSAVESF
jgi:hypothetical protein